MTRIRVGDTVRAHLDASITGVVTKILREQSETWTSSGPLTEETFCMIKLSNSKIIKLKLSDVYVEY